LLLTTVKVNFKALQIETQGIRSWLALLVPGKTRKS